MTGQPIQTLVIQKKEEDYAEFKNKAELMNDFSLSSIQAKPIVRCAM